MIGYFIHKETGAMFEYDHAGADTVLAPPPHGGRNMAYTHRVHLNNDLHGQGWRHALVRGGVAYVITDEHEDDETVSCDVRHQVKSVPEWAAVQQLPVLR